MADTTPAAPVTPADPNDVGTFISDIGIGYVEPDPEIAARIEQAIRGVGTDSISKGLLDDLLTIKLLAPNESKDLIIYNIPEAIKIIRSIRDGLVRGYYESK